MKTINKKLKACIIGLGQVGIKFDLEEARRNDLGVWTHFSAYERLSQEYDLVAAVDPDENSWVLAKERNTNIHCFKTIDELITSGLQIHVVSISSPDQFHYQNLEQICNYVNGVFLEKPISTIEDTAKADNLINKLLFKNLSIYVNYYKRTEPTVIEMLENIKKNNEKIKYIECRYSGPFMAVGSHALDLLNYIVDIEEVKASVCHSENEGDGYSAMMVGINNELVNLAYTGKRHEFIFELEVVTNNSSYELSNNLQEYEYKKLIDSKQYKGYKEYELFEYKRMTNISRFTSFLQLIYLEILENKYNYTNVKKSIKTQQLMIRIINENIRV